MKQHLPRRLWIYGVSTLALVCIVISVFSTRRDISTFQGKTVPEWLDRLDSRNLEDRAKAMEAISSVGTNALPILQEYIQAKDSWLKKKLITLSRKQSLVNLSLNSASDRHRTARNGYAALGSSAVPNLIELFEDPILLYEDNPAYEASRVLSQLGSSAVPALVRALTNTSSTVRYHACFCLGWYDSLHSDSAVTALAERMEDPEWTVRCRAAHALGTIQRKSGITVQALARGLRDPESAVRINSARGLAAFGERAAHAVPLLVSAQERESSFPECSSEPGLIGRKSRDDVVSAIKKALSAIDAETNELDVIAEP